MDSTPDALGDLRPNYLARLHKRIDALRAFLQEISGRGACDETFEEGHRCVHSMISSAAIFGYADLSTAARAAEVAFELPREERTSIIKERVEDVLRIAGSVLASAEAGS